MNKEKFEVWSDNGEEFSYYSAEYVITEEDIREVGDE